MTAAPGPQQPDEVAEAWAALPASVSGDAAPEGTTLAARIRAIVIERDQARAGWRRCHKRHAAPSAQPVRDTEEGRR